MLVLTNKFDIYLHMGWCLSSNITKLNVKFIDASSVEQLRIYIVNVTCVNQSWVNLDYVPFTVRIEFAREQQNTAGKKRTGYMKYKMR